MINRILQRTARFAPGLVVAVELLIKRSLATLLWLVWRSRLHPYRYLRTMQYTTGRYYLDQFLARYVGECHGRFLEFGDPRYRSVFPASVVEQYDIFNIEPGPEVTIVGDIQDCPHIADNTYDVIVCTQVLEHVRNPFCAAAELHRILKPGGRLLLTVPAAYPYHAAPGDYWRYTRDSLQMLIGERFRESTIISYGNRLTVVAAYWFWMRDHLPRQVLDQQDPDNPTILAVYARK